MRRHLLTPAWTAVLGLLILAPAGALAEGFGTPTIDGLLSPSDTTVYNLAEAVDSTGDAVNGANLDMGTLWVANDASNWYFLFTINADVGATNWGKYLLFIDTTGDSAGGNTAGGADDAWGRPITVLDPNKPEYTLRGWVDNPPYAADHTQFWEWSQGAGSWTENGDADLAALSTGTVSGIEWAIEKSRIGDPDSLWCEVVSTGGNTSDPAQDTVNDPAEDWNAADWTTTAVLMNSTLVHKSSGVDVTPPVVNDVSVQYLPANPGFTRRVLVTFNEPVDPTTAQIAGNYTDLNGKTVLSAVAIGPSSVRLTLNADYGFASCEQIRVTGVKDVALNTIVDNGTTNVGDFYLFQLHVNGYMSLHMVAHEDSTQPHTFGLEGGVFPLTWDPLGDLQLDDADADSVYSLSVNFCLPCSSAGSGPQPTDLNYKFSHYGTEWEPLAGNHFYAMNVDSVPAGKDTVDIWWGDIAPSNVTDKDIDVVFRVQGAPSSPFVTGDSLGVNGDNLPLTWNTAPPDNFMADDGVLPDSTSGDGVYTTRLTFPAGTVKNVEFKYLLNALTDSTWVYECQGGAPNRSVFLNDSLFSATNPIILDVAYFDDCQDYGFTDKAIDVLFRVMAPAGDPPYGTGDSLAVAGSVPPLTWDTAPPTKLMLDDGVLPDSTSGDGIFSGRVTFPQFSLKQVDFKFLLQAAADSVFSFECTNGEPNRNVFLNDSLFSTTTPIILDVAYYDDCNWATGVEDLVEAITSGRLLEQSYPNPFRSTAVISYTLPNAGPVKLDIYDVRGRHVRTLVDEARPQGRHNVVWNGRSAVGAPLPNGIYFYRLIADERVDSRKILLMR